jgi:hypothetical protein
MPHTPPAYRITLQQRVMPGQDPRLPSTLYTGDTAFFYRVTAGNRSVIDLAPVYMGPDGSPSLVQRPGDVPRLDVRPLNARGAELANMNPGRLHRKIESVKHGPTLFSSADLPALRRVLKPLTRSTIPLNDHLRGFPYEQPKRRLFSTPAVKPSLQTGSVLDAAAYLMGVNPNIAMNPAALPVDPHVLSLLKYYGSTVTPCELGNGQYLMVPPQGTFGPMGRVPHSPPAPMRPLRQPVSPPYRPAWQPFVSVQPPPHHAHRGPQHFAPPHAHKPPGRGWLRAMEPTAALPPQQLYQGRAPLFYR